MSASDVGAVISLLRENIFDYDAECMYIFKETGLF